MAAGTRGISRGGLQYGRNPLNYKFLGLDLTATFMSAVSITYFMLGNECLGQFLNHKTADGAVVYNTAVAYPVGIIAAALFLGIFLYSIKKRDVKPQYETLGK